MTLDGFITALSLALAMFALVPSVQRLRARSSPGPQGMLAFVAVTFILWLELWEPALVCPSWLGRGCGWLVLPGDTGSIARKDAFATVCLWVVGALLLYRFNRASAAAVPALGRLATRLVDEGRLGEALALLEPHVALFDATSRRRARWQRWHDWLATFGQPDSRLLLEAPGTTPSKRSLLPAVDGFVRFWANLLPAQTKPERVATDTLRMFLHSPQVLDFVSEQRPYQALPLLSVRTYGCGDFADAYLSRLIARPGSALYQELEQNQNIEWPVGYALPDRNRLLHFLFSDSNVAVELGVWKPIGDYLQRLFDGVEAPGYIDRLNGTARWYESEWWSDPGYVGVAYFDVMVTSALRQDVANHMWLYYFPNFAERLARLFDANGADVDRNVEFPTRGARLLYELVDKQAGWIKAFVDLPAGSPHTIVPANLRQVGMSIPFSAAEALGRTLLLILRTGQVDGRVEESLHDIVVRLIRDLPRDGAGGRLRAFVIQQVVRSGGNDAPRHVIRLAAMLTESDHILQAEVEDYRVALDAAYPPAEIV